MFKLALEGLRNTNVIADAGWIIEKVKQYNKHTKLIDCRKAFNCVSQVKLLNMLRKMGILKYYCPQLKLTYQSESQNTDNIGKRVWIQVGKGKTYSPLIYSTYIS